MRNPSCAFLLLMFLVQPVVLADKAATDASAEEEIARRQTAVALNYCRAALHRIRRQPQKRVFLEEQQRILNNLNLSKIADPEVISLYRAVLDEISQVEVSEKERRLLSEQYRHGLQRQLSSSLFVIGAQVATGQATGAIQSGANSWWDYRNRTDQRDNNLFKVNRTEFNALMSRSSTFLDSFWKLTRKNRIPDSWLIRDQDLDQLAVVLKERDGQRRLRMLKRMERFMTCYPPYWYYVARTQQQLGQLDEAVGTYQRLTEIGSGHFRQDDMLAGSLANMALIQEVRQDPAAVKSALASAEHSSRNWEANLVCAWVLGRHAAHRDAEDLILCNLDEQLETSHSSIALVSLYYHSNDRSRLAELLEDEQIVANVPIPGLLLCARALGGDEVPQAASRRLASSLRAEYRQGLRTNVVMLRATPGWKLRDAQPRIAVAGRESGSTEFRRVANDVVAEFRVSSRDTSQVGDGVDLTLQYPGVPSIRVTLTPSAVGRPARISQGPGLRVDLQSRIALGVEEIEVDGVRLSVHTPAGVESSVRGAAVEDPVRS